jgi:hypothetical protein
MKPRLISILNQSAHHSVVLLTGLVMGVQAQAAVSNLEPLPGAPLQSQAGDFDGSANRQKPDAFYVSSYALAIRATPSDNAGSPYTADTGFGFGATAGWRREVLGVELGLQQLDRRFAIGDDRISTEYFNIPLSLRVWLGDAVSFGFGPSLAIGSGTVVVASAANPNLVRNLSFNEASLKGLDIGFTMSTQVQLLPESRIGMTLGAQYSFSLLNHASAGDFRYTDLQVLAGIRIGRL